LTGIADEKYSKLAGGDIDQFIRAHLYKLTSRRTLEPVFVLCDPIAQPCGSA
jgi:hypothetical protein